MTSKNTTHNGCELEYRLSLDKKKAIHGEAIYQLLNSRRVERAKFF